MKANALTLIIIFLLHSPFVLSQDRSSNQPENNFEVKIGAEINRIVPSVGIGKNFYISNYVSLSPELLLAGVPILSGMFRINFPIAELIILSPHGGVGLAAVGLPVSSVGILGVNISYKFNNQINFFVEPRIFYFNEKTISAGSGIWEIDKINTTRPFVINIGIGF